MEAHSSDVNYSTTSSLRSPAASLRDWTSKPGKLHWRDLNLETSECNKLSHWAIFTIMLILIIWSFIWINNFFIWCFFFLAELQPASLLLRPSSASCHRPVMKRKGLCENQFVTMSQRLVWLIYYLCIHNITG